VNETADIERAIGLVLNDGPLRMLGDGRIRAVGCDCPILAGACVVEAVR